MPAILIVEDDPVIALHVRAILEDGGFRTLEPAATADDALALLAGGTPDMAVLDVKLRGASSEPVAAELRARGVPFVLLTGLREVAPGLALHGAPLVRKPFLADDLLSALRSASPGPA